MELQKKIYAAFGIFLAIIVVTCIVQIVAENLTVQTEQVTETGIKTVYTMDDFRYGPQNWRPYYRPIEMNTGREAGTWYMMFVESAATPYGGNPHIRKRGWIHVNYTFEDLSGMATFHLIGIQNTPEKCLTDRQTGYGSSGYYVTGTAPAGSNPPESSEIPSHNHVDIISSGLDQTYSLNFWKPTGGLDGIHITTDPLNIKADVTDTRDQKGGFNITSTGGSSLDDLLLLVAVNTTQPDDFRLKLETEFVERPQ